MGIFLNYLEFPAVDLQKTKDFYAKVFGWSFVEYGQEYLAFDKASAGLDGGFFLSTGACSRQQNGSTLAVLYHPNLFELSKIIQTNGGEILQDIFAFPGGKRFHFADPNGNELAVWSEE